MQITLGLVGEKGGGKGTLVKLLKEIAQSSEKPMSVDTVKSSEVLAETLKLWDLPLSRSNLQQLAIIMNAKYGDGTLTHAVKTRMEKSDADIVIYEGIRWPSDVDMVRAFPNSKFIYITAPVNTRYERTKQRKEKAGEGEATLEQFIQEESVLTETNISKIAGEAEFKIKNTGSIEDLRSKVEELYRTITT